MRIPVSPRQTTPPSGRLSRPPLPGRILPCRRPPMRPVFPVFPRREAFPSRLLRIPFSDRSHRRLHPPMSRRRFFREALSRRTRMRHDWQASRLRQPRIRSGLLLPTFLRPIFPKIIRVLSRIRMRMRTEMTTGVVRPSRRLRTVPGPTGLRNPPGVRLIRRRKAAILRKVPVPNRGMRSKPRTIRKRRFRLPRFRTSDLKSGSAGCPFRSSRSLWCPAHVRIPWIVTSMPAA